MNLQTAIARCTSLLGSRGELTGLIRDEMDMVQTTLLEGGDSLPWFLLSDETAIPTVAGTATVALPTGFLREVDRYGVQLYDAAAEQPYRRLTKGELGNLSNYYSGYAAGEPVAYAITRDKFALFPTPDAIYSLRLYYMKADTPISSLAATDTNLWLTHAPDWLMAETLRRVASLRMGDAARAKAFEEERMLAKRRVLVDTEAREAAASDWSLGDLG